MRADAAVGAIDLSNPSEIVGRELEVEDVNIPSNPLWCHGFRDDRQAAVEMPTDHDLCPTLAVLRRKFGDGLVLIETTATERAPGLRDDSVLLVELPHIALLESWMQLDLVQHRNDAGLVDEPLKVGNREVRDTNRSSTTFLLDAHEGP